MTRIPLPEAFIRNMKSLLKGDFLDFMASYEQPPHRGAHLSGRRGSIAAPDWAVKSVPWSRNAWYLDAQSQPGAYPLHWAGQYYLQEPSAMAAVSVLNVQPGEIILDLCAAPGGKSSQIASLLEGKGMIVSNDPYTNRARELSRNMERMGVINSVVTSNQPEKLVISFPDFFDKILVDAPCSGEGMFRKEPEVISHWHDDLPTKNATRQLAILKAASVMLKPGGHLVYSTCTFNQIENEGVIEAFLDEHSDWLLQGFHLPGLPEAESGILRLWPQKIEGEGHFVALLRKPENSPLSKKKHLNFSWKNGAEKTLREVNQNLREWVKEDVSANGMVGETFVHLPSQCPSLDVLSVLRFGLHLASRVGKTILPDHALALAMTPRQMIDLDVCEIDKYRLGQTLTVYENVKGFAAPALKGWPIGWGKASNGVLKNHYPKGLRKPG